MTSRTGHQLLAPSTRDRSVRKRHWRRWIIAGIAALVVLAVLAAIAFMKLQPVPAALSLPADGAKPPSRPLSGTWSVGTGSEAGFRLPESALGVSSVVVGRTGAITGSVIIASREVTSAAFRIDLSAIKVGGKNQPQFATSLDTSAYPTASISLTAPVTLRAGFATGSTVRTNAGAELAMNGTSWAVTVTLSARRSGSALEAVGTIPIAFSRWGIKGPTGFGFLASLADHASAEFLLVLHRS